MGEKQNEQQGGQAEVGIEFFERGVRKGIEVGDVFYSTDRGITQGEEKVEGSGIIHVGVETVFKRSRPKDDETRLEAKFIVETLSTETHNIQEIGPMWAPSHPQQIKRVQARRLSSSDEYDPAGELIEFLGTGELVGGISYIYIIGRRKRD